MSHCVCRTPPTWIYIAWECLHACPLLQNIFSMISIYRYYIYIGLLRMFTYSMNTRLLCETRSVAAKESVAANMRGEGNKLYVCARCEVKNILSQFAYLPKVFEYDGTGWSERERGGCCSSMPPLIVVVLLECEIKSRGGYKAIDVRHTHSLQHIFVCHVRVWLFEWNKKTAGKIALENKKSRLPCSLFSMMMMVGRTEWRPIVGRRTGGTVTVIRIILARKSCKSRYVE